MEFAKGLCGEMRPPERPLEWCSKDGEFENVPEMGSAGPC